MTTTVASRAALKEVTIWELLGCSVTQPCFLHNDKVRAERLELHRKRAPLEGRPHSLRVERHGSNGSTVRRGVGCTGKLKAFVNGFR